MDTVGTAAVPGRLEASRPAAREGVPPEFASPEFRARRAQNWMVLGLLYAFFYMTRYNFAAVMTNLSAMFGWSNTQLGVFETFMPLVYGLSVVLNGPISDRIGGKKSFLFGAAGVFVMNLLFGACILLVASPAVVSGTGHDAHVVTPAVLRFGIDGSRLLVAMAVIWGINGYFQSFGALSIVKVNAHWFHVRERGTFAGVFGILIRFGLILAFSGVPLILTVLPLQFAFWLPALCVGLIFAANLLFMQNSPGDAGFGAMDTGDGEGSHGGSAAEVAPPSIGYVMRKVFASRSAWLVALISMMIGMVRRSTIDSWYPKFFKETFGVSSIASFAPYQAAVWGIALFGIAGGFAFGITSDRVFGGRRAPVIAWAFGGMIAMLGLFSLAQSAGAGPWVGALCLAMLSFFVNGAHGMVSGAASMDLGGRKAAATATGLFDGMQYLASSMVGIGMGWMLDHWGWKYWQLAPIPFAVVGACVALSLWNVVPGRKSAH